LFLNKPFQRFARKEGICEADLCDAVARAERGLVDADLGGGVIKQRIARPGQGRSGGFRSIILYRVQERAFFVYGFPKNERENITQAELVDLRDLAKIVLSYDEKELAAAIAAETWKEVDCDEQDVQE
jgi:hypothetical protein